MEANIMSFAICVMITYKDKKKVGMKMVMMKMIRIVVAPKSMKTTKEKREHKTLMVKRKMRINIMNLVMKIKTLRNGQLEPTTMNRNKKENFTMR
jgi:hypothetical protein